MHGMGGFHRLDAPKRFCWLIGHPEKVSQVDWKKLNLDHVWCLSSQFLPVIKEYTDKCSVLIGGSSKPFQNRTEDPKYDIVFMGQARANRMDLIKYLVNKKKYRVLIAGGGQKLAETNEGVDWVNYHDNNKLSDFFNQGWVTFYTGHGPMRVNGFVPPRVFDIYSCSERLCIHETNSGLGDIFRFIPTFSTKEDLASLVDYYLTHPEEMSQQARECRKDVTQFNFDHVVDTMVKFFGDVAPIEISKSKPQQLNQVIRFKHPAEIAKRHPRTLEGSYLTADEWGKLHIILQRAKPRIVLEFGSGTMLRLVQSMCKKVVSGKGVANIEKNPYDFVFLGEDIDLMRAVPRAIKHADVLLVVTLDQDKPRRLEESILKDWKRIDVTGTSKIMVYERASSLENSDIPEKEPVLTFVTRTGKRPLTLEKVRESVRSQNNSSWQHIFIVDRLGKGLWFANEMLQYHKHRVHGQFVMVLDDDRIITDPDLVTKIHNTILESPEVEVIVVRGKLRGKIYPGPSSWEKFPAYGTIDSCNVIVRRDLFKATIHRFATDKGGDYSFIREVFNDDPQVVWVDEIVSAAGNSHKGRPEWGRSLI